MGAAKSCTVASAIWGRRLSRGLRGRKTRAGGIPRLNPYEAPRCQETAAPRSGLLLFFRRVGLGTVGLRFRARTAFLSMRYRRPMSAPNTYGGSVVTWVTIAASPWGYALRPRNNVVPSDRPRQRGGSAYTACQLASGSG